MQNEISYFIKLVRHSLYGNILDSWLFIVSSSIANETYSSFCVWVGIGSREFLRGSCAQCSLYRNY